MTQKRLAAGLKPGELALAANTTRQSIHRIEKWTQRPSIRLMERLRNALAERGQEISADEFLAPPDKAAASSVEGRESVQ